MMVVLQEAPNALNLVAPDCSSFTVVSRGTSMRTPINPLGRDGIAFVHSANGSVSRLGLIKNHGILTCIYHILINGVPEIISLMQAGFTIASHGGLPHYMVHGAAQR